MTTRKKILIDNLGFITTIEEENALIAEDRFQQVVVRCGGGRFRCSVQDLQHWVKIIGESKEEYVRDASVF